MIVAAADCTGYGVPGAFMSMLGTTLLNHVLSQLNNDFNAGNILTNLREEVKSALRQSSGEQTATKDGMDISLCVWRSDFTQIDDVLIIGFRISPLIKGFRVKI